MTEFKLLVLPEDVPNHQGLEKVAYVDVCAQPKTERLPSLGVLVDAAEGGVGLASALFELTSAFWRTFDPRTTCTTLEVTYHEGYSDYKVVAPPFSAESIDDGAVKCDRLDGEWRIHASGQEGMESWESEVIIRIDEKTGKGVAWRKDKSTRQYDTCTGVLSGPVHVEYVDDVVEIILDGYQYVGECIELSGRKLPIRHTDQKVSGFLLAVKGDFCEQ